MLAFFLHPSDSKGEKGDRGVPGIPGVPGTVKPASYLLTLALGVPTHEIELIELTFYRLHSRSHVQL